MQPITNQDGGQAAMGSASIPDVSAQFDGPAGPTQKGMGSEITSKAWRPKSGSTESTVAIKVDGPR